MDRRKRSRIYLGASLAALAIAASVPPGAAAEDGRRVLYFTHEPGKWHDYTTQLAIFRGIAKKGGWDLTVMTGTHDEQLARLRTPDFGKPFDAVVYNFCFAHSRDVEAADNLMEQTREHGVPALLVHCAMHSWWPTYKSGQRGALGPTYQGHALAELDLVEAWRKDHPHRPFPVWGDFTGIASTRHGPRTPIDLVKLADHPATRRFPANFTTANTELYNNVYQLDAVVPLIRGTQEGEEFVVMWTCPQGASQVLCLTLGHDVVEWIDESFQDLMIDSVNYLLEDGSPSNRRDQ